LPNRGPVFAVYTSFHENYELDISATLGYLEWLYRGGARVFYLMPYNARYSQLTTAEIKDLTVACGEWRRGKGDAFLITSDPLHCSTRTSLEVAHLARESGSDAFSSIIREKYYSRLQFGKHFGMLSEAGLPLVAHMMPMLSSSNGRSMDVPIEAYEEVASLDLVQGIKEDHKDLAFISKLRDTFESRFDWIYAGRKSLIANIGRRDSDFSYITGTAMLEPGIAGAFWSLLITNSPRLNDFVKDVDDFFHDSLVPRFGWHAVNRVALSITGLIAPRERAPMHELDPDDQAVVREVARQTLVRFESWR